MMSLHQTGPLHQITGIGRTTSLTCHLPRANVFLPSAKCISSPCKMHFFPVQNVFLPRAKCISSYCKMHFFRLQNAFLPIAKFISSHYKKLSFIFYFEINLFHMQNVVLSRAKFISSDCKMFKMRSFPMENVHPLPSLQIAFLCCFSVYPCIPCIPPVCRVVIVPLQNVFLFIGEKIKCKYACVYVV